MPIDTSVLSDWFANFVDELPTEATFRNALINVRIGEAPKVREMLIAGFSAGQMTECLMKAEDTGETEPAAGEILIINGKGYKVGTVTPLLSLTEPAGYRLTISRV